MNVVNVSELDAEWNWVSGAFRTRHGQQWTHVTTKQFPCKPWMPRRASLSRIMLACAARARSRSADTILVSHGPRPTFYAEIANRTLRRRRHHLAFSFNYTDLPTGMLKRAHRSAFRTVDHFAVFSSVEKSLYADYFDIPPAKIEMVHWGVRPPDADPAEQPLVRGDYVCAVGSQARDYSTLMAAMQQAKRVRLVLVATEASLAGVAIPANVEVRLDIALRDVINIITHCRFMVLPLRDSIVPCGHVTLVSALHLGKAVIATDSRGAADYLRHGDNARLVPAKDPTALATAITELIDNPAEYGRLGANGLRFAKTHCTEERVVQFFDEYLRRNRFL